MNLFIITSVVPYRRDGIKGVTAVNVMVSALIREMKAAGHGVTMQVIMSAKHMKYYDSYELHVMQAEGIEVMPILHFDLNQAFSLISEAMGHFYPSRVLRPSIKGRSNGADAILTLFSPEGVAASVGLGLPIIAYQGDVDFEPWQARTTRPDLFPVVSPLPRRLAQWFDRKRCQGFKNAHMRLMDQVSVIANISKSSADMYRNHGHPRSVYIGSTWIER